MVSRRNFLKYLGAGLVGGVLANTNENCFFPGKDLIKLEEKLGNIGLDGKKLVVPPYQVMLPSTDNYNSVMIHFVTSNNIAKKNSKLIFDNYLNIKKYSENKTRWVTFHNYLIKDLDNDKRYPFYLTNSNLKGCVRTAPKQKFNFSVVGDTQEWRTKKHDRYMKRLVVKQMLKNDNSLVMHCGDVTNDGGLEDWLFNFMPSYWDLLIKTGSSYVKGNHDYRSNGFDLMHKGLYNQLGIFENSINYSFQMGDINFIILDSNFGNINDSRKFLEKELDETKTKFNLAFFHHPFDIETDDLPLDAVFCGHLHNYRRYKHEFNKTKYVVTGGGGGTLVELNTEIASNVKNMKLVNAGVFNHHVYLEANPDQINAKVIDIFGKVRDKFIISKY